MMDLTFQARAISTAQERTFLRAVFFPFPQKLATFQLTGVVDVCQDTRYSNDSARYPDHIMELREGGGNMRPTGVVFCTT